MATHTHIDHLYHSLHNLGAMVPRHTVATIEVCHCENTNYTNH